MHTLRSNSILHLKKEEEEEVINTNYSPIKMMSELEKRREQKIKRNEQRLRELGLLDLKKTIVVKPKEKKRKRTSLGGGPIMPSRRSTRQRKTVQSYYNTQDDQYHDNDEGSTDNADDVSVESTTLNHINIDGDYDEDDDDDDEEEDIALPELRSNSGNTRKGGRRERTLTKEKKKGLSSSSKSSSSSSSSQGKEEYGGISFEYAKTSRSTCRKCMIKIEKGSRRVGMQAWIVGRQAITWQCAPSCFLKNLILSYESSGRTKCKATNKVFEKGELRFGTRSHTATNHYKVDEFQHILQNVLSFSAPSKSEMQDISKLLSGNDLEGFEFLTSKDQEYVQSILIEIVDNVKKGKDDKNEKQKQHLDSEKISRIISTREIVKDEESSSKKKDKVSSPKKEVTEEQEQPKIGTKMYTKGKVQWKFGAYICYGTLLSQKETLTHCYARTHKGNIKTLAKEKTYWSIIG